jgi:hypothetical protein
MLNPEEILKHITDLDIRLNELQQARADALDTLSQIERTAIFLSGKRETFTMLLPTEAPETPHGTTDQAHPVN